MQWWPRKQSFYLVEPLCSVQGRFHLPKQFTINVLGQLTAILCAAWSRKASLVPRPPRPAFVACSTKSGEGLGRTYHVMRAAADVMFSLLTSGFVLSPSLFFPWIQLVLSVQFVLRVRLLLDWSWLATVRDVSRGTHHVISPSRPSSAFRTTSNKSWAWRPGNEAILSILYMDGVISIHIHSVWACAEYITLSTQQDMYCYSTVIVCN